MSATLDSLLDAERRAQCAAHDASDHDEDEARRLRAQDRAARAYTRWPCSVCGGGHGHHMQGCPEAIGEEVAA